LCVQKWSYLLSSDAFWKFSLCEIYNKFSGRIITISQPQTKPFIHEVQTDFGSFLQASFIIKLWAHFLDFCVQKWSCLLLIQTHFGNCGFARFMKKVLGTFSRFMRPKSKRFAVEFRHILEVLRIRGWQKDFWAYFHDFCVQKRSSLPWSSDGFQKFSPCKLHKKDMGAFSQFLRPKMKLFALKFKWILEVFAWWG